MATNSVSSSLSPEQGELLAAVLDTIIPPGEGEGLPGAGEVGLGEVLPREAPELVPLLAEALEALRDALSERGMADFARLEASEKRSLLETLAERQPAFLPAMLFQVYTRYYREPRVLAALGLQARPPYPLGYELEGGDLDLLAPVRARPPLYRPT